ncbi:DNA translocase FtsK [Patescibacteria group bacterium]|nr:DNA translocase FtsK [Patescibacteria group bacterium]MBU1877201.1 DNA translocase FtsK [Patescibacteria group bacterium]
MAKKKNRNKAKKKFKNNFGMNFSLPNIDLPQEIKDLIWGIMMFLAATIISLSFWGKAGFFGRQFISISKLLIGDTVYAVPLFFLLMGFIALNTKYRKFFSPLFLAVIIICLSVSTILSVLEPGTQNGGLIGQFLSSPLLKLFGFWATQIILSTLIIIGLLIFWQLLVPVMPEKEGKDKEKAEKAERKPILTRIFGQRSAPKFKVEEIINQSSEKPVKNREETPSLELKINKIPQNAPKSKYKKPPLDLLEDEKEKPTSGDTQANTMIIQKTLENFGISVEMAEINVGPTVTQYSFKPAEGIRLSKITALSNNLSLALAAHPIRIEAPIPGRSLVGIEIPNRKRAAVRLKTLISSPSFKNSPNLTIALGKDVAGAFDYANLTKMPHMLVAGATGSGKTIFLNSLILSLLYQSGPELLRLILVDPKRVEFTVYNDIPHLLCPVIYDAVKTINCLDWLVIEMGRRFEVLSVEKVRNIDSYNEKMLQEGKELMPYIVFIVDELADLIMAKGREIEARIVRLAQLSRAVGIHLILATQRPSVEVITGLIKANITSRISFKVASQIDSRTILDTAGSERLIGLGDMLFISNQVIRPKRIQGAYISEKELKKAISWISENNQNIIKEDELSEALNAELDKTIVDTSASGFRNGVGPAEDSLYYEAERIVLETRKASASFLQRRLSVGYARAARLLDILEAKGVVGPADGAKPRQILITDIENQEEHQEDGNNSNFGNDYDEIV